jgi:prevent-host-death family protein
VLRARAIRYFDCNALAKNLEHVIRSRQWRFKTPPNAAMLRWASAATDYPSLDYMTTRDYHIVMKTVGIADLKARLSEHLRSVRKGRTLTVLDRGTPIARIVPCAPEAVEVRRAVRRLRDLARPPRPAKPTDSVAVLLDDRRRR